jgi:hypothetical protein
LRSVSIITTYRTEAQHLSLSASALSNATSTFYINPKSPQQPWSPTNLASTSPNIAQGGDESVRPRRFHWALLVCPKSGNGPTYRYHVINTLQPGVAGQRWRFEARPLANFSTQLLLTRMLIAKIDRPADLGRSLESLRLVQGDPAWTCRVWVSEAIQQLDQDGILGHSKITDWARIEQACREYAESKYAVRRWSDEPNGRWIAGQTATYDLLHGKEVIR